MDEEELPILTKKPIDTDATDDGLPILKKKDATESVSPSASASTEPGMPSEKSSQKSTGTNNWQAISEAAKAQSPLVGAVKIGRAHV